MTELVWGASGSRYYETGVSKAVIFERPPAPDGSSLNPVVWDGLLSVDISPTIESREPIYIDGVKFSELTSYKEITGTISAYTYPDRLLQHEGFIETSTQGVLIGGQPANDSFNLVYQTQIGNDIDGIDHGFKLHFLYDVTITPEDRSYSTIGEEQEPIAFSWTFQTTPMVVGLYKPTSYICLDSRKTDAGAIAEIQEQMYVAGYLLDPGWLIATVEYWTPPLPTTLYPSNSSYPSSTTYPG